MTDINSKKNVSQLQKLVIDGLEDVKAQDIKVFNTEALSPLFERVIIASGTSNRQTKALASSVRDVVREAGFGKPRVEGEENGEWIIVDCGPVVAHIMQPAIRDYYHLEEIWGEKPVRFKHGEDKMFELIKEKKDSAPSKGAAGKKGLKEKGEAKAEPKGGKHTKDSKNTKGDKNAKLAKGSKQADHSTESKTASKKASSNSKGKAAPKSASKTTAKTTTKTTSRSASGASSKAASKSDTKPASKSSTSSVAKTLSTARTKSASSPKSASSKSKGGSSAPTVKTRNSPPRA